MNVSTQLTLLVEDKHEALIPYWRQSLKNAVSDAFRFRNSRGCTGWSYALGGYGFARLLFVRGQINRRDLRRYWRFFRRLARMEKAYWESRA